MGNEQKKNERWRAEMPKFEPITEQWRYAFAPEKVIADYKRSNAELDAAEAENRELRENVAALEARIREIEDSIAFALKEAKERLPDYPWGNPGPVPAQIVWALGESYRGVLEANKDLHERIRELTEWRPMETAPRDWTRIRLRHATTEREYIGWFDGIHFDVGGGRAWPPERFHGWLPSTEGGEG